MCQWLAENRIEDATSASGEMTHGVVLVGGLSDRYHVSQLAAMARQQTRMERTRGKTAWLARGRVLRGADLVARSYLHRPDPGHGQCDRQTDDASEDDLGDLAQPVL